MAELANILESNADELGSIEAVKITTMELADRVKRLEVEMQEDVE